MDGDTALLVGVWRLRSFEARRSDGEVLQPFGREPRGSLVYTASGHFSVHLIRPDRPRFEADDPLKGTPEEIDAAFKGVISYYGSYECDRARGLVVHHVAGALFPNWEGKTHERLLTLEGDRLRLTTHPTLWGGGEIVGVVDWQREA
jgi:hypothetical protein